MQNTIVNVLYLGEIKYIKAISGQIIDTIYENSSMKKIWKLMK